MDMKLVILLKGSETLEHKITINLPDDLTVKQIKSMASQVRFDNARHHEVEVFFVSAQGSVSSLNVS